MRSIGCVATRLTLWASPMGAHGWGDWAPAPRTDDLYELGSILRTLWFDAPSDLPILQVGVRLEDIEPTGNQLCLFEREQRQRDLMTVIDAINKRGGADTIYLGSMHQARGTAPRRIPFGKPPDLELPDVDNATY